MRRKDEILGNEHTCINISLAGGFQTFRGTGFLNAAVWNDKKLLK